MDLNFRTMHADEIECKATVVGNKIEVSLHTKAATCTRLLNETVGPMNWEKEYTNGNKNCIVRIWDHDKEMMIAKEDCGGPLTDIDGHKGQASNGFKRVCALGWGLGLELYSQPEILLDKTDDNVICDEREKLIVSESYYVKEIEYDDNKMITHCVIVDSKNRVVYDGPNENGESNVVAPVLEENLVIPEDADNEPEITDECDNELPDNTDGFDDDFGDTHMPPFTKDYRKEFEAEIKRTHVKRADILKVLKVSSFEDLKSVDEATLDATLDKLRSMKTFGE